MTKDEALGLAAGCWCDKRTEHKVMDIELAEVFAEKILALGTRIDQIKERWKAANNELEDLKDRLLKMAEGS